MIIMSNSDFYIQNKIETSLEQEDFSQIIILLDSLPSKNIRRALYLLSKIFPNKIEITENEFKFIKCILSNNKFIVVQSISDFLRAISILNFNDLQKQDISDLIFQNLNILSKNCDFELNILITKLIEPNKFFMQVEKFKNNLDDYSRKYLLDFIFYEKEYLENGFNEDEINDFIKLLSYPR